MISITVGFKILLSLTLCQPADLILLLKFIKNSVKRDSI